MHRLSTSESWELQEYQSIVKLYIYCLIHNLLMNMRDQTNIFLF